MYLQNVRIKMQLMNVKINALNKLRMAIANAAALLYNYTYYTMCSVTCSKFSRFILHFRDIT